MDVKVLDSLFQEYGYIAKENTDSYRVYLLNQGMYHGAEILVMDGSDQTHVMDKYSKLGYHAKKQEFKATEDVEKYLFSGFFNTKTTAFDIERRYDEFANSQVKHYYDANIKYQYINMPYIVLKDDVEHEPHENIISAIKKELNKPGAHLIIVEAAAGFGKTCTAYEVYKSFLESVDNQKPIFTELSRNRDAKQFKYILWSEIDKEKDTTAKQDLVIYNIKKGRIPLIIDGFDELLSKDIDPGKAGQLNDFEQVETMLSTIGDLLTENSKVILTSRKTAIFAGTEFGDWVDSYEGKFDVIRFQLNKPDIKNWLSQARYDKIKNKKVPLENISNPVLLTYLRNIDQESFDELLIYPETITDKYFEHLLNREKERQNLIIRWEDQMQIFENLAKAFALFDITGESRNFVKELIVDYNRNKLLYYRELSTTKQTIEELSDTLTNHALLDRVGNKDFITFINEFIFGYLLAKGIQKDTNHFPQKLTPIPEYFIELAIHAFKFSSKEDRLKLWKKLSTIKGTVSLSLSIGIDSLLLGSISGTYEREGFNSYHFENTLFNSSQCKFVDVSFTDITFENCVFDPMAFHNVTFTGCKFIDCSINKLALINESHQIHCYGCDDFHSGLITCFDQTIVPNDSKNAEKNYEILILGKYFKVDNKSPKMRYISAIRKEFEGDDLDKVFCVFEDLKKRGYILIDGNNSHISRNGINYYHKNVRS
ncbi:MAG: NTPase [Prevotellaceae bacterium]|nr:NTPase [Candidatus Faecinaster equi]